MDQLPSEVLYNIADFLRPAGRRGHGGYERGLELLNLMKTCRGFYDVLLNYWYRTLLVQHGSEYCFRRAVLKSSGRALKLIYYKAGDDFPISDDELYESLEFCVEFGRYEPFLWLRDKNNEMQIDVVKDKKCSLLYTALRAKDQEIMYHLLDEADEEEIRTRQLETDDTLLTAAVKRDHNRDTISYFLRRGLGILQQVRGKTALDIAIEANSLNAMQVFIQHDGKMVNRILQTGSGYVSALEIMFKKDPYSINISQFNIFQLALMIFDNAPHENLVDNGFQKDVWGKAVLTRAIATFHWQVATLVTKHGMGIEYNRSILTTVVLRLNDDPKKHTQHYGNRTVEVLLEKGVGIDFGFINGITLLHLPGPVEVASHLIDHGFDVNARTQDHGWTPLHTAVLSDNFDMARMLINYKADINSCNNIGHKTPLTCAVLKQSFNCIMLLLESGARTEIADSDGKTPLRVALDANYTYGSSLLFPYARKHSRENARKS
jgi:ankyrin repeat protein